MTDDSAIALGGPPPPTASNAIGPVSEAPIIEPMPERTATLSMGLLLVGGLLGQLLFFRQNLGLNVPLWIAFVLGAAWLFRPRDARLDRVDLWLPLSSLAFAVFIAVRDEGMLLLFDLGAAGILTLASVVAFGGHRVSRGTWRQVARLGVIASVLFCAGAAQLARGLAPIGRAFARDGASPVKRLLRGLAIALPLLVVFALLFAAADAVFAAYLRRMVALDLGDELVPRVALGLVAAWLLGGTMVAAWISRRRPDVGQLLAQSTSRATIASFEVAVVFGALDVMFGLFVILQGTYLLGGVDTLAVSGMTYSEYARRGFFELIAAAALSGGVIVVLAHVAEQRDRAFRILGSLLAVLTGVVLVSAVARLGLYQAAYGWTELRFYALAAIVWLAAGLAATLMLLARDSVGRVPRFMIGAGLVVAVACNLVGPQSLVTQQNVERVLHPDLVAEGGYSGLDVGYLRGLQSDTARVLLATVAVLPEPERTRVQALLVEQKVRLLDAARAGWPSWNWARQTALDALAAAGY